MWCSNMAWFLFMTIGESAPYTVSHIDHTISWITSNLNDSSVIYLGNTPNSGECEASCKDLNYLCDKSESDVLQSDGASFLFNNADCEITINGGNDPWIHITPNLISTQYRIDVGMSVISGYEAGIYFKSNNALDDQELDYFMGIDPNAGKQVVLGYDNPTWTILKWDTVKPQYNTKYTLSVDVDGNNYTTYFDGDLFYTGSFPSEFVDSYAGVYSANASAIYYSWRVNISDGEGDKVCAAYVMDKNNGDCYGYYGTNYTQMEHTLSSNNNYDAAIVYPYFFTATPSVPPTQTAEPSPFPSDEPSKMPSNIPSFNPIKTPSADAPSNNPSIISNTDTKPTATTSLTRESSSFTFTKTDFSRPSDRVNKTLKKSDTLLYVLLSIVGLLFIMVFIAALMFFVYAKNHKQQQSVEEMVIADGNENNDDNANHTMNDVQNVNENESNMKVTEEGNNDDVILEYANGNTQEGPAGLQPDEFVVDGDDEFQTTAN